jgi:hypothetical protein
VSRQARISLIFLIALAIVFLFAWRVYAAEISNVKISGVTEDSATVDWTTDVSTDAMVNYGLDPSMGVIRDTAPNGKTHSLLIPDLDPSTTYYFRALSADAEGNRSTTAGFTFTTKGTPIKKIVKEIKKLKEPEDLIEVIEETKKAAEDIVHPPTVMGQAKVSPETTKAEVTWTTDRESGSVVYAVAEKEYNKDDADTYTIVQGDAKESVKKHSVTLMGLEPSTSYHYKVSSTDDLGLVGETEDDTFTTRSILPNISNLKITRIQETSATITWSTGKVLAKGLVSYTNLRTKATRSVGNPVYATNQSIQLTGLQFGTRYQVVVSATNQGGDVIESKPMTFVTVRDVIPPEISKVNNQSTLFPGEDTKIQTILSWVTDEPTTCQVFYVQGLIRNGDNTGDALPAELNPLTMHTQVIVGFAPATVYKFWLKCQDPSHNSSQSEDFVLITPIKEKNIIDVILENFQGTFGWVNNVGK